MRSVADAWPHQDAGAWDRPLDNSPLLPPLPALAREGAPQGWVLEWPVSWLGTNPLPRISLRPAPSPPQRIWEPESPRAAQPPAPRITRSLAPRVTRPLGGRETRPLGGNVTRPLAGNATRPQLLSRPEIEARLAELSMAQAPQRLMPPRAYLARVSAPIPRPQPSYPYRRRAPAVLITLLIVLVVAVAGILWAGDGTFDPGATFDPFLTLIGGGGGGTVPPTATAPGAINAPGLGSESGAFASYFSAREPNAETTAQYRAQVAGHAVTLNVQFGSGIDRRQRVVMIIASDPTFSGWDTATADAICSTFLPSDAHLRKFTHVSGQTEYVYASANLASLFAPAYFVDDTGAPVTRGTLNRLDQPGLKLARGVGSCTLGMGQHYK
jgi:hypothetical protein